MRIIDADVLMELAFECDEWWENADVWIVAKLIDSVPTIYEFKEGKWLETYSTNKKRCSNCDRISFIAIYPWFHGQASFCPACGAKMDDVEDWEFRSE